jgi:hypothetical protein
MLGFENDEITKKTIKGFDCDAFLTVETSNGEKYKIALFKE